MFRAVAGSMFRTRALPVGEVPPGFRDHREADAGQDQGQQSHTVLDLRRHLECDALFV